MKLTGVFCRQFESEHTNELESLIKAPKKMDDATAPPKVKPKRLGCHPVDGCGIGRSPASSKLMDGRWNKLKSQSRHQMTFS